MPFMKKVNGKSVRDYDAERQWELTKKRSRLQDRRDRNNNRYDLEKDGKVKVGDGKHVDHKKALTSGGSNSKSNLRVISAKSNLAKEANRKKRK